MTDSDVRIRREIVSALEKIGGEEAVDLLVLMAEDTDREIREKAVIAVGVIGITDSAPLLIDVAKRNPSESIRIVNALGKLGGHEARTFLTSVLDSEERLTELAGGLVSKDELRVAIIRALGKIGYQEAIDSIRKFKDQLSTAQKIFFKQSSLQKTIADVLSRY
jgi:HEAT repeat protein